jgi:hypothetical protein
MVAPRSAEAASDPLAAPHGLVIAEAQPRPPRDLPDPSPHGPLPSFSARGHD